MKIEDAPIEASADTAPHVAPGAKLAIRRIPIDTHPENTAFLLRHGNGYSAEQFQALRKLRITAPCAEMLATWRARSDMESWYAKRTRDAMVSEMQLRLNDNLLLIRTCIAVLPLIGLLGTVTGMIQVFDVMAYTGAGNARLMAGGVSAATIPTMAGLVAALSGLIFGTRVFHFAYDEAMRVADSLRRE